MLEFEWYSEKERQIADYTERDEKIRIITAREATP